MAKALSSGGVGTYSSWSGEQTTPAEVAAALAKLEMQHTHDGRHEPLIRTLNLVVTGIAATEDEQFEDRLSELTRHSPARTIVLNEREEDGLNAETRIYCASSGRSGVSGHCNDRVILWADRSRLEHADSLIDRLLVRDLEIVAWVGADSPSPADDAVISICDQIVIDTAVGDLNSTLERAIDSVDMARVHDLAWGRTQYWRARVATEFDATDRLEFLQKVDTLKVEYCCRYEVSAFLTMGWIAARLGWQIESADSKGDEGWTAEAKTQSGNPIRIELQEANEQVSCGGLVGLEFITDDQKVELNRGIVTGGDSDIFPLAVRPLGDFSLGYDASLKALKPLFGRYGQA